MSKKSTSRSLPTLTQCRAIKELTFAPKDPLLHWESPCPLGEMVMGATFYSQVHGRISQEWLRELAFSKQMWTVGQDLTPAWETENKGAGTLGPRKDKVFVGLVTAWTLVHKCCLGNRCRLHGREGSWSCVGYYLLGHLKGLGDLQIRNWNEATSVRIKGPQVL